MTEETHSSSDLSIKAYIKVALWSADPSAYSKMLAPIIFLISQLQIIIVLLKPAIMSYRLDHDSLPTIMNNICNAVFPENHIEFDISSSTTLMILEIILIYVALYVAFIIYVFYQVFQRKTVPEILKEAWNLMMIVHPRVLFYPIHTISLKLFDGLSDGQQLILQGKEQSKVLFQVIFMIIMVVNILCSFILTTTFETHIKTKNVLAAKTNILALLDLSFKLIFPIIWTVASPSKSLGLALMIIGILFCLIKNSAFFGYLPYYRVNILKLAVLSQAAGSSFSFAALLSRLIGHARGYSEYIFLLFLWILFAALIVKIAINNLEICFINILMHPTKIQNPYHAIHYQEVYKFFAEFSVSGIAAEKVRAKYFDYISTVKQAQFSQDLSSLDWTRQGRKEINEHFNTIYLDLLNSKIKQYPKNKLLKAILARSYAKQEDSLILANNILEDHLAQSFGLSTSFYLIKLKIVKKLKNSTAPSHSLFDIQKYIQVTGKLKIVKKEILEQLKLQSQLWKAFQSNTSDFLQLLSHTKTIHKKSRLITKLIKDYKNVRDVNYMEALLVSGLYLYFAQNETAKGQKIINDYCTLEMHKNQAHNALNDVDNIMLNAFHFVISTLPRKLGAILDCSGKAKEIFGIPKDLLVGQNFTSLMPSIYGTKYNTIFTNSSHFVKTKALEEVTEVAFYTKKGYILPMKVHISLSYLPECGLSFYALMKPTEDSKRLVILSTQGHILDFSKEFGQDMNIPPKKERGHWEIMEFCPEMARTLKLMVSSKKYSYDMSPDSSMTSTGRLSPTKVSLNIRDRDTPNNTQKKSIFNFDMGRINTQKVTLGFTPNRGEKASSSPLRSPNSRKIIYTITIDEHLVDGSRILELKMEKQSMAGEQLSPLPPTTANKNLFKLKTLFNFKQDEDNFRTITSTVSPTLELVTPFRNEVNLFPTSPALSSHRMMPQITTFRTSEETRLIDREDKTTVHNRYDREGTSTIIETYSEGIKYDVPKIYDFTLPPIAKGDSNIDEEDEQEEYSQQEGLSEILSEETSNKAAAADRGVQKRKEPIEKLKQIEDEVLQANLGGEASSTHESQFAKENTKAMRAHRLIRKLTGSKKHSLPTLYYNIAFIVAMATLMSFLIWLNFETSDASKGVGTLGTVIHNAYFRNYWTKNANQDTILMLVFGDPSCQQANFNSFNGMIRANQNLEESVASLSQSFQDMFYEKNVRIFDIDDYDNIYFVGMDNTFEATKRVYSAGIHYAYTRTVISIDDYIYNHPTRFVVQNSDNDLYMRTDSILDALKESLFNSLTQAKHSMMRFLIITMVTLGLFIGVSFKYVHNLNKESFNFMEAFFTLPASKISTIESCLVTFKESLEQELEGIDLLEALRFSKLDMMRHDTKDLSNNVSRGRTPSRSASMKKLYTRNYFMFASLVACLAGLVGFTAFYYHQALDKLKVLEKQQMNSNAALDYLNTIADISIGLEQLLILNATITIRNESIYKILQEANTKIKTVSALQNSLKNSEGEYSPGQEEILFNFQCDNSHSENYSWGPEVLVPECQILSNGVNIVGLVQLLNELSTYLDGFLVKYETLPLDMQSLYDTFMLDYVTFGNMASMTNISIVILLHSYAASTKDFDNLVEDLGNESVALAWIAIAVTISASILTWIFVIRKLSKSEFEERKLLALIPNRLILSNFLLKKYMIKISRNQLIEARKLLTFK